MTIDNRIAKLVAADPRLNKAACGASSAMNVSSPGSLPSIEVKRMHRELPPIIEYRTPDSWPNRYPKVARWVADCADYPGHADAVELVGRFLDPVLSGELVEGAWHPDRLVWSVDPFTRRRDVGGWT